MIIIIILIMVTPGESRSIMEPDKLAFVYPSPTHKPHDRELAVLDLLTILLLIPF